MARAVASLAVVALVAACGDFVPGAGTGPIVDIAGVGPATLVQLQQPESLGEASGTWSWRWTGARTVLAGDDGQVLIAWSGGPRQCWVAGLVHLDARGRALAASIGEWAAGPEGRRCGGDRGLWGVLVPDSAVPRVGGVSDWPPIPVNQNGVVRP